MSEWQPIETVPKDGRQVLLWVVHPNAQFSADPIADGWAGACVGYWTDHNNGGFVWNGLAGAIKYWMPLPAPPEGATP